MSYCVESRFKAHYSLFKCFCVFQHCSTLGAKSQSSLSHTHTASAAQLSRDSRASTKSVDVESLPREVVPAAYNSHNVEPSNQQSCH